MVLLKKRVTARSDWKNRARLRMFPFQNWGVSVATFVRSVRAYRSTEAMMMILSCRLPVHRFRLASDSGVSLLHDCSWAGSSLSFFIRSPDSSGRFRCGTSFRCCRRLFVRIKILLLFVQIGRVWIWRMISGDRGDRTDLRKVPLPPCRSGSDSPIRSPCVHPRVSSVMWGKCFRAAS